MNNNNNSDNNIKREKESAGLQTTNQIQSTRFHKNNNNNNNNNIKLENDWHCLIGSDNIMPANGQRLDMINSSDKNELTMTKRRKTQPILPDI